MLSKQDHHVVINADQNAIDTANLMNSLTPSVVSTVPVSNRVVYDLYIAIVLSQIIHFSGIILKIDLSKKEDCLNDSLEAFYIMLVSYRGVTLD